MRRERLQRFHRECLYFVGLDDRCWRLFAANPSLHPPISAFAFRLVIAVRRVVVLAVHAIREIIGGVQLPDRRKVVAFEFLPVLEGGSELLALCKADLLSRFIESCGVADDQIDAFVPDFPCAHHFQLAVSSWGFPT